MWPCNHVTSRSDDCMDVYYNKVLNIESLQADQQSNLFKLTQIYRFKSIPGRIYSLKCSCNWISDNDCDCSYLQQKSHSSQMGSSALTGSHIIALTRTEIYYFFLPVSVTWLLKNTAHFVTLEGCARGREGEREMRWIWVWKIYSFWPLPLNASWRGAGGWPTTSQYLHTINYNHA